MAQILLIEPDKLLATNIQNYLRRYKHKVAVAANAQTGLTAADQQSPELIIMDWQLAGPSGLEFLHELRSYPDWLDIPVLVYSSMPPDRLGAATLEQLTISRYLYKPTTSLAELVAAVDEILQPIHVKAS